MRRSSWFSTACLLFGLTAIPALAQYGRPVLTRGVGIDQKLKSQIPLDLTFTNEANQTVPLKTYFGQKPVVLALIYYRCPSLCNLVLNEMVSSLGRVPLEPGRDYNVVAVSIDPAEDATVAAEKKANYAKQFKRASFNNGWHFLTGKQPNIKALADAVGFHYRWDDRSKQFVHAGGIMVATPSGELSRYFYGLQYSPADMRLSLVNAANERIGSPVDYITLFCFHYDASQGKYTVAIFNVLRVAGVLTILALGALLFYLIKADPNRTHKPKLRHPRHVS